MGLFNTIRMGASAGSDYEVERSLRFNKTDYSRLERTPSSTGNQKVWTFSAWFKRTKLADSSYFISSYGNNDGIAALYFDSSDRINTYYDTSGSNPYGAVNERKYRDVGAWMHIVWQVDAISGTQKIWINGVEESLDSGLNPPNFAYTMNQSGQLNTVGNGAWYPSGTGANMYLAEVHFSDGNKYEPSDFAETNATTGQWVPISPSITYGTNGFYLNFSDNSGTTATTLGTDSSGNGNNFTPNNFSVAAGAGNDSVEDTPTNNFPTLNPLAGYSTNFVSASNGNLDFSLASNYLAISTFTIPASGKWYAECVFTDVQSGDVSVINPNMLNDDSNSFDGRWNGIALKQGGEIRVDNSTVQSSLTAIANDAIVGVKIDRDAGTVAFTINGSANGTAVNISSLTDSSVLAVANRRNSSGGSNPIGSQNYGQRPFSHLPTGYKALCSANLPNPTILLPNKHFDTTLYTGNGSTGQSITSLQFQPDWLWFKSRSHARNHAVNDSVRGRAKGLYPDITDAEFTDDAGRGLASFDANGFTVGEPQNASSHNNNGESIVNWAWKGGGSASSNSDGDITSQVSANTSAGFSIVSYTVPSGSGYSVGHGLGAVPQVIFVKNRDTSSNWDVYSVHIGNTKRLKLNSTAAEETQPAFNNQTPTSTVFYGLGGGSWHGVGSKMINYVFSEVAGYSKFGSYTGNGNDNGTFVFLGFRPAFIITKRSDGTSPWRLFDNKRPNANFQTYKLEADSSGAEATGSVYADFLSNGFKIRDNGSYQNASGGTYIYLAFAESPFKNSRAR